ncbi:MAG: Omp28-related outer membrane protein [Saprospiraceae bacterium]|nr:Omp28-related outer membrane protein [Saprospiraceae bacterium]
MQKLFFIFSIIFFISCEEVTIPITDVVIEPTEKVVLREELTGAKCPNCPKGTKAIENIIEKHTKNVIAVGIHGSFLAEPVNKDDPDFRNEDAKNLENWFRPWFGKPAASIQRQKEVLGEESYFVFDNPDLWQAKVEEELQKPLELNLFMDISYNETSREIAIDFAANPLVNLNGDYNISIYVTESHIKAGQANGTVFIDDYEHNHVLRKIITDYSGSFFAKDMVKGGIIKKQFTYTLPQETADLNKHEHTSIVAFIHKSGTSNRDVIQAISKYLVE